MLVVKAKSTKKSLFHADNLIFLTKLQVLSNHPAKYENDYPVNTERISKTPWHAKISPIPFLKSIC